MKRVITPTYNYCFNEETGYFKRWGKTEEDDPQYSPIGLEILDLEVSSVCSQKCAHCYKSNTAHGKNMRFKTFKTIVDKIPTLTQIAFGIGDIDANPDLFKMFAYCREKGIAPNVTINGFRLTNDHVENLARYCGAVAVSNYQKDVCYNAVQQLTNAGLKQVNIHQLMAQETRDQVGWLLYDHKTDERLKNLNAIVFLSLKKKGRGYSYKRLPDDDFKKIVDKCLGEGIPFGLDSCAACKFLRAIDGHPKYEQIKSYVEPCESGLFSGYINVDGCFFPCSFTEGMGSSIDVIECEDFLQEVWYHPSTIEWRWRLLEKGRECPWYEI
jgi:MoaA/NifB/PqqE/SkfB family radical SAM enzyme